MFSKILIRLIDQSITPAILLIASRIVSIILISKYRGIPFNFDFTGFTFGSVADYIYLNSYSTLAMICALVIGLSYILVKAYVFHDTHITPRATTNVFAFRMANLIQSSYDLYTQGSIWISFLFFMCLTSGFMAFLGLMYFGIFYVSLGILLIMLVLFILDIENEIKVSSKPSWQVEDQSNE